MVSPSAAAALGERRDDVDTSWDARTHRMLARLGSAPRPRDIERRRHSRSPSPNPTPLLSALPLTRQQLRRQRAAQAAHDDDDDDLASQVDADEEQRSSCKRDRKGCKKKALKKAVPAKSSLGMAAVGVMSTSIGRAAAGAGVNLAHQGMELGAQTLMSLFDTAEVQIILSGLVTVMLWEASSRNLSPRSRSKTRVDSQFDRPSAHRLDTRVPAAAS